MTYDFFATKTDKIQILDFILNDTDLEIFDSYSEYGKEVVRYKRLSELIEKFDLDQVDKFAMFTCWSPRFGGKLLFTKIDLNPLYTQGHAYRYRTDGWGSLQLRFGGLKANILTASHIGHFSEKGVQNWEDTVTEKGKVIGWNWIELQKTSRKLKYQIHQKMSVRKIGSRGVLSAADELSKTGIKFSP
jgi:hypothetical protein